MPDIAVAIINASTVLGDQDVAAAISSLQRQISEHLAPIWGVDASLFFVPGSERPPAGAWWVSILDNSDQAGTLGYHDLTSDGLPLGKVFAASDILNGYNWTVSASHEILEMLIDPDISLSVFLQEGETAGTLYAYEICDPCEIDQYGYALDGVLVSDFVFPSWFESFRTPGSCQFDATQQINAPFQLLAGSYISTYKVNAGSGWQQLNGPTIPQHHATRAPVGSRRERRHLDRGNWVRSSV
jgi:hypothetical protein